MEANTKRILFDVVLGVSLFLFPWELAVILILVGLVLFPNFYESLLVGLIFDSLYVAHNKSFFITYPFTISVAVVFLLSFLLKEHITFFHRLD